MQSPPCYATCPAHEQRGAHMLECSDTPLNAVAQQYAQVYRDVSARGRSVTTSVQ